MQTFQKPDGSLWAFDSTENDQPFIDACIADGGLLKTDAELAAIRNPTPDSAQLLADQQAKAKVQLLANDVTASRCKKGSVPYPDNWLAFDVALRAIAKATVYDPDLEWPVTPDYPEGS